MKHSIYEGGLKYRPDYKWPNPGTDRKCPRFEHSLEIIEDKPNYYGKPWWCYKCQWQFSEEDFPGMKCEIQEKEQ